MKLRLRVHPAGWALLLAGLLLMPSTEVLAVLLALLWHEAAHVAALWLCGAGRVTVELTPFGGMMDADAVEAMTPGRQAATALSGVAASALAAWLCWRFAPRSGFWYALFCMNASLALLNCLPVWPLDGARAVMALAARLGLETAFRRGMLCLAYALGLGLVGLGLWGAWRGHVNLSLLLLGPYLCYAAHQSALGANVRRMQRAGALRPPPGEVLPMAAYMCAGEPGVAVAARVLARAVPGRAQLLCVLDEETGAVRETLTEWQLARRAFDEPRAASC